MTAAVPGHPRHLYVHVPFCARRCSYCDFSIAVRRTVPVSDFVGGVRRELDTRLAAYGSGSSGSSGSSGTHGSEGKPGALPPHAAASSWEVDTIYFGGGTPSRLGADGVAALLDTVRERARPAAQAEITLEVNPEDVTPAHAVAWAAAGVNRVSLGVQSFHDNVLRWMHRVHSAEASARAVHVLRDAGLTDISVDLIFSVPDMLQRDWTRDVDGALALLPTHVSLYGLTVEPGTPLARWTARNEVSEAPDDVYATEFLHAHETLEQAGFVHYEVSNYGRPGHEARHNSAYWHGAPYLGIGPSAHGFDGRVRRWNIPAYARWLEVVASGADPLEGSEALSPVERETETVYLGLRTRHGLPLRESERDLVAPWEAAHWVTIDANGLLRCTATGWLRLDAIAAALTAHRSP